MRSGRRVVITGLGMVTPLAPTAPATWEGLKAGRSAIRRIQHFDASAHKVRIAGEVGEFSIEKYMSNKDARRLDRYAQFALVCAGEALEDAGVGFDVDGERRRPKGIPQERIGVVMGTGIGGMKEFEEQTAKLLQKGPSRVSPLLIPKLMPNAAAGNIAMYWGLKGLSYSASTACASGAHSIGLASDAISGGLADMVVAGGCEAAITPVGVAGFENLGALSQRNDEPERASRPFDAQRDGFVIAEGAASLVLEEFEHAKKRGARIYAEFLGYGFTSDAYHITAPDESGEGPARCIRLALEASGMSPDGVDYINAHGTSTPYNDKIETLSIKKALGEENARRTPVSSIKGMIGHSLGAAGAIEAAACCLAMRDGVLPPTINYENPDPDCDLDYVPNEARENPIKTALSTSLGFGGHNACLCFGKL
ncbi:MAG TPA: beta-ketoacyl-[acyl-carrier-protein] synthase II [Planctomycetes bacterium]|nr:beta-ketoacyl-[acyl-carrier-protein] synthase II [Planctomycetota bacterium]